MHIKALDEPCRGKRLEFRYRTGYHYQVQREERVEGFSLTRTPLPTVVEKCFADTLLEPWLERPQVFAAVEGGLEMGYLEVSYEGWNNRLRISNLWVDGPCRGRGVGTALMERAAQAARSVGARELVLET